MKLKISLIVLTIITTIVMWYNSPMYDYQNRPTVSVIKPKKGDIYNSIVVRGYVEEGDKRSIRLDKSVKIESLNVKLGDKVKKGDVIFSVSEIDEIENVQSVMNVIPKINSLNDIENYYIPKTAVPTATTSPEIESPIDGIITEINIKEGDAAIGYIPVLTISDFNKLLVRVSVSELYIKDIKLNQNAEISGEAFANKKYKAKVKEISPVAKQKTTLTGTSEPTIDVLLEVLSKNTDLKPGFTTEAKIFTETHEETLSVPYSCLMQENDSEYVLIVKNEKISKVAVETGFETDSSVEIVKGIGKDDRIVLNPTKELEDNMAVNAEVSPYEF